MHENGTVRDLRAWHSRGWCRMEKLSNALADTPRAMVVIESTTAATAWPASGIAGRGILLYPVGEGAFTEERDRESLGPVILQLIASAERRALDRGDMVAFQGLRAVTGRLAGSGALPAWRRPADMSAFLHHYRLDAQALTQRSSSHCASPLSCAVLSGRHDIASQLLALGAEPNDGMPAPTSMQVVSAWFGKRARYGGREWPVLHLAAAFGLPDIVLLLLQYGADPRRRATALGFSALHCATIARTTDCVEVLLRADPAQGQLSCKLIGWKPFHCALFVNNAPTVAYFVDHYPHLMYLNQADLSPAGMCLLVGYGDLETLRIATRLSCVDDCRDTVASPLLRALFRMADSFALVPLPLLRCWYSESHRASAVTFFKSRATVSRCTALHVAAFHGHLDAVDLLLEAGSDPSSKRHPHGFTPLHIAAIRGHGEVVGRLLAAGADSSARCNRGVTARELARFGGVADDARHAPGGWFRCS